MLSVQIDIALESSLEYPWYSIYGQLCQDGPLAVDAVEEGEYSTWHVVNYQVRLVVGADDNNDITFSSTVIPDVVQSIVQKRTTIPPTVRTKLSLIIEIKPRPSPVRQWLPLDVHLGPAFLPVWTQIAGQAKNAFGLDPVLEIVPSIAAIGEYWSYREWTRDSVEDVDTYDPPPISDLVSDTDSQPGTVIDPEEIIWVYKDAGLRPEDHGAPYATPIITCNVDKWDSIELDPPLEQLKTINDLQRKIFRIRSASGQRAFELIRDRGVDLNCFLWHPLG